MAETEQPEVDEIKRLNALNEFLGRCPTNTTHWDINIIFTKDKDGQLADEISSGSKTSDITLLVDKNKPLTLIPNSPPYEQNKSLFFVLKITPSAGEDPEKPSKKKKQRNPTNGENFTVAIYREGSIDSHGGPSADKLASILVYKCMSKLAEELTTNNLSLEKTQNFFDNLRIHEPESAIHDEIE